MTSSLASHFSIFGLVFFVLKFLLGIAGKWSRKRGKKNEKKKKTAVLTLKPWSHVRILTYRTWAFVHS